MNRVQIFEEIESYRHQIDDLNAQIRRNPDNPTVPHWKAEIINFERKLVKLTGIPH